MVESQEHHDSMRARVSPLARAARAGVTYALLSGLWIALSDAILVSWVHDARTLMLLQIAKGWAFIAVTAALLFSLLLREFRSDARLMQRYTEYRGDMLALSQFRKSVIDNASIWINVLDAETRVTVWNKAAERISGFSREDVLGSSDIWELLYPDPEYRAYVGAKFMDSLDRGLEVEGMETRIQCRDGTQKVISWNSRRFLDAHGGTGAIAIGLDMSSRKEAEQALQARERQLAILMANVPGMVYRCSRDDRWRMKFVSSGCLALTGYAADDLIEDGAICYIDLVHPEDRERMLAETRHAIAQGQPFAVEYRIQHRNGNNIWVWEQGRAIHNGDAMNLEGIIVNITDRKQMEQKLEQLAVQDPLTGLLNRRELALLLREELEGAERKQGTFALLWVDIDNFKAVNDRFGHLAGDEVLRRVSQLIKNNIRALDFAARYGGDEMVVALPGMSAAEGVGMAKRLQRLVQSADILSQHDSTARLSISVGVAAYPEHGRGVEQICDAADNAMYAAKQAGRNRVCRAGADTDCGLPRRSRRSGQDWNDPPERSD